VSQTWEKLIGDPQVALRILSQDYDFKQFVEESLPQLLQEISGETLNLEKLMEAQFLCAEGLANLALSSYSHERIAKIQRGLSQYEHAGTFLATLGTAEKGYWQQHLGLNDNEYRSVQDGEWTVRDLLERRPALILAPCLRPTSFKN
jgi:hypothetical protein